MEHSKNFYKDKKILVTGGAGFIGSHLVEKLVALEAKVTILDNFSTGKLAHLHKVLPYITVLFSDIRAPFSCYKATMNQDIVFHLASFVSVPESIKNPTLCNTINIEGTKNILEACRKNNIKTVIYASSSAVYGDRNDICKEDDIPSPKSPYASSKLQAEELCKKYAREYCMNIACLRYFNVYGERQNPQGSYAAVVAKFSDYLLNQKPLTIFGDGLQTRDFIPVDQVVHANINIALLNGLQGEVFNVGSGQSMNLFELIKKLELELKTKPTEITFLPARQGDVLHSKASCEKYAKITSHLQSHLSERIR